MALDFPTSPTPGQKYPASPVVGVPTYTWDGEKWTTSSGVVSATYVAKAGDTMTGYLTLPSDPTTALQASTKQYVDNRPIAITSDIMPPVASDNSLWWKNDSGQLYIKYNDGNTTQWVVAVPQPDTSTFLTKAPQSLTTGEQTQVRQNVYAAPFDAMAYSGLQINGAMEVSQEYPSVASTANPVADGATKYFVDGLKLGNAGPQGVYGTSLYPSGGLSGFSNCVRMTFLTGNAAPAAGNAAYYLQLIEGYRVSRLRWGAAGASPITISFWAQAARPGNYSGSVSNGASNRVYVFAFTINAANAWEYKTVTIPGDITGTWSKDNTIGMQIYISQMVGTTYQASPGSWIAGFALGATGTINGAATPTDVFFLTGLAVFPGIQAPTAAQSPFVMRPYDQELPLCMRQYQKLVSKFTSGYATAGGAIYCDFPLSPIMRTSPTITFPNPVYSNGSAVTINTYAPHFVRTAYTCTATGTSFLQVDIVCDARL